MEISQHIKNLLLTNGRVILNDLGSFESKHIPARIDKETKTMTPPFKIVVFNPAVKQDAGLLAKHMSEKEGITFENAKEQISEYVKTIKTKLDKGEKVVLQDLGEMKKTPDGKYEFSYLSDDNLLLDSFGLPKVSLTEENTEQNKPLANKSNIKKEPVKKTTQPKKEVKQKPVKKTPPPKKQKPVKQQKPKKEKKKRRFWPVLLILIGLLGILTAAVYFFKPDLWQKGYGFVTEKTASLFGNDKEKLKVITPEDLENQNEIKPEKQETESDTTSSEVEDNTASSDEQISETSETTEEVANNDTNTENVNEATEEVTEENTTETNTTSNAPNTGKYHIIIGSVKTEAAAQKEKQRYAAKGISTVIVYASSIDRYRISLGGFPTAKAAQNYYNNFIAEHGNIEAWVWKKK